METRSLVAVAVWACAQCIGCGAVEVVVAEFDAGRVDAPTHDAARTCTTTATCDPGEFCSMASCTDSSGTCQPRPVTPDGTFNLACGCDGTLYWNDSVRKHYGVAAATSCQGQPFGSQPPLTAQRTCADRPCDTPAICAKLVPVGSCADSPQRVPPSVCFVPPPVCPPNPFPFRFFSCGSQPTCMDYCTAIQSKGTYQSADPSACP